MALDVSRAESVARDMARGLKLSVGELAEGVVRVANANMERAIRVVSVERGHRSPPVRPGGIRRRRRHARVRDRTDARDRHGDRAETCGSALRVGDARGRRDARLFRQRAPAERSAPDRRASRASHAAGRSRRPELSHEGFAPRRIAIEQQLDVRYVGQSYEITLPFTAGYRREFDRRHGRLYGYSNPDRAVEVVAVRVRASGLTEKPSLPFARPRRAFRPKPAAVRNGRFDGRMRPVAFHRWPTLEPGATAFGPAVVTGPEATVVIPPGWRFRIDGFGNVIANRGTD